MDLLQVRYSDPAQGIGRKKTGSMCFEPRRL